jgi:hypothetical protein
MQVFLRIRSLIIVLNSLISGTCIIYRLKPQSMSAHQICALINLGEDFCHIADYVFVNEDYNIHCVASGHYLLIYICVALIYKLKRVSSEKCE